MERVALQQKLHEYVDIGDDKLLKMMYAMAKEYTDEDEAFIFSEAELAVFEQRRNKRLSGESKTYNWEEAKRIIKGKKLK